MRGLWLSRGVVVYYGIRMKTLRFLCFASLLALLLVWGSGSGGDPAAPAVAREETPAVAAGGGNSSGGSIMITMTGVMGDEG